MNKVLLIVLITVIVALAGVLVWQNWGEVEPIVNNQLQIIDETADWETYTSSVMGFSIKYPFDLIPSKEINENGGKRVFFMRNGAAYYNYEFSVIIGASYGGDNEALMCGDLLGSYEGIKQVILDGKVAILGSSYDAGHSDKLPTKIYYICQDDTDTEIYFIVRGYLDADESIYLSVIGNILSSFKILK